MRGVVIGCGRVGSAVARGLAADGWDVTVLEEAGVGDADAAVVSTRGDNTNIVIGQVLQLRYGVPTVVVRILDPARAKFYSDRGMSIVCPTQTAISSLLETVRTAAPKATPA